MKDSHRYAPPGELWVLPQTELEDLGISYPKVIDTVEQAYRALRTSGSDNPVKTIIEDDEQRSISYSMLARDADSSTVCFKAVYEFDPQRTRDNYNFHSFIFLCDDTTGQPIALMDVVKLGPLRSSATSALMARAARPEARSALVMGTGVQGQMALPMLLAALPTLERLQVYGTYEQGLRAVRQSVKDSYPDREVEIVEDVQRAVADADIVIGVAGLSARKEVRRSWMKPGAVAVLLGYGVHADVLHGAEYRIATDADQMRATSDDLRAEDGSLPPVDAELPDILMGRASARRDDKDVVFAYNSGMAITDAALGRYVADLALAANRGQRVNFW